MKRRKLKAYVMPTLYTMLLVCALLLTITVSNVLVQSNERVPELEDDYVSENLIEEEKPVLNETDNTMIKPYINDKVRIGKYFYDYKSDSTKQENSIIYHENTYMQNSGIDYILEEEFDVVSILDGTVTNVSKDELLGNIVEIKHDSNYISIYQSLGAINVKKGDIVTKGQVIGKSGTNQIDKDMGNHLHFELYIKGQIVDPTLHIGKEINVQSETKEENNNNKKTDNTKKIEE